MHFLKQIFGNYFVMPLLISFLSGCGASGGSSTSVSDNTTQESTATLPSVVLPTTQNVLPNEILAEQAIAEMGIGINLGNTLDAPYEGQWALSAKEYYIQAFKDAGFKHVRIPVTWNNHTLLYSPYDIDDIFLDRVEQIVDWALTRDLYVIVNVHHDDWLKSDFSQANQNRFSAI